MKVEPLPEYLRPSQYDLDHFGEVLRRGDWFDAELYRLVAKADPAHRERLRLAFPAHVAAYEAWLLVGID